VNWSDNAIILATRKHGESSAIVTLLTEQLGLYNGLVKGITAPRLRGIYQQGNLIHATWKARLPEHLGFLTGELLESSAPIMMGDRARLAALSSICAMISHCLPERESAERIFHSLYEFIRLLKQDSAWHLPYIRLELYLLQALGFGLDLSECAATGAREKLHYVSPKTGKAVSEAAGAPYHDKLLLLPNFLKESTSSPTAPDIMQGFKLTGYFLEKWNFSPRNMKLPAARVRLEELICSSGV
jgi:DNA repair protein RecO (recombination protein O)